MEPRDPRIDPRRDDELEISHGRFRWFRRVISVSLGGVRYVTNMGRSRWLPLHRWQQQVKDAKVLKRNDA